MRRPARIGSRMLSSRYRTSGSPPTIDTCSGRWRSTSELTPEAIATLHEVGPTVLPASLGAARVAATVDRFVEWTRGYREGVALSHGYGHPRLQKSGASPVPGYVAQLAALDAAARAKGG